MLLAFISFGVLREEGDLISMTWDAIPELEGEDVRLEAWFRLQPQPCEGLSYTFGARSFARPIKVYQGRKRIDAIPTSLFSYISP